VQNRKTKKKKTKHGGGRKTTGANAGRFQNRLGERKKYHDGEVPKEGKQRKRERFRKRRC